MLNPTSPSESFKRFLHAFIDPMSNDERRDGYSVYLLSELSASEQTQAEDLLIKQLEQGSTDERLVIALGELHSQRAVPLLETHLQAMRGKNHVIEVAVALWKIAETPMALTALLDALTSLPNVFDRMYAIIGLRYFRCQQVEQALQKALSDEDYLIRYHAVRSLLAIYNLPDEGEPTPPSHPAPYTYKEDLTKARQALSGRVMSSDLQTRETAIAQLLALGKNHSLPMCEGV